ncbi:hypothetical protein AAVH_13082 [Aphelenchoides avenae]|nr:hypothetical protein AAVH_13082 [Aphelenchus avenae]
MIAVLHDELECMSTEKFRAARRKSSPYVRHDPVPVRIVAVVGATHVAGIKRNWGERAGPELINELLRTPRTKWYPAVASALIAIVAIAFALYLAVF